MKPNAFTLFLFFIASCSYAQSHDAWETVHQTGTLRWCADTGGGAPYVFPSEKDPNKIIGFEIDFMDAVAHYLGVQPKLILGPWEELVPMLLRGDCDMAVNGLEITEARKKIIDFSIPYYYFSEQLTSRQGDERFKTLADLSGHRVGTLSATLAQDMLRQDPRILVVPYPSPVECYKDLELGRLDAAFMDGPIAAWYIKPNRPLTNTGNPIGESTYGIGIRKDSPQLRSQINDILKELIFNGQLKKIYTDWNLWTPMNAKHLVDSPPAAAGNDEFSARDNNQPWWKFIPLLIKGAGLTIVISFLSMALAVVAGFLLCIGKLYGGKVIQGMCNTYIEVIRGTPLLIQLYLLYYGLPNLGIQLNALVAAVIGMGFNYAAYEAEIYRAGLLSIPKGQSDAARSLGMTRQQSLRYILLPQAIRTILPPSTNDFIALFKDTSLVSIITVAELTKAYGEAATTTYRFLELGLVTAALYFAMSYPLSLWSRSLEKKVHA